MQASSAQGAKNMPVFKRNTVSALKIEDDRTKEKQQNSLTGRTILLLLL